MKILVTGSKGFIAKNLRWMLAHKHDFLCFDQRQTINDLGSLINESDLIIHLAGVNRSDDEINFMESNVSLTKEIINHLRNHKKDIPIIFSSSIQVENHTIYGLTKKRAEDLLVTYAKETKKTVKILRLPNVFGKWSKPFYNSVVSTFCYQLTHQQELDIHDPHKVMTLLYIDDLINSIDQIINSIHENKDVFVTDFITYDISLQMLADKLKSFIQIRQTHTMPIEESLLDKKLHATLLSYVDKDNFSYFPEKKEDQRGFLSELIKHQSFGQIFISKTKPGMTRGNHYHHSKIEKFIVIEGKALIKFRKIDTDEVIKYVVDGDHIQIVDIIPGYTHSITNIGETTLITLFWANEIFDQNQADTFFMEV